MAISKGIAIEVAHRSGFLDTNVPENEKLYGYHRLKIRLFKKMLRPTNNCSPKRTDSSRPEDGDQDPVLIGRHDIAGVTYKEQS